MSGIAIQDLNHVLEHAGEAWPALAGARIFITGGTGFVGKWLVETLLWANRELKLGASVVVLTRSQPEHPPVSFLQGDVCDFPFPDGDFPFVIHAANEGSFERDVEGTRRVLEFARTHGTRRFLFTSSGAVYGRQPAEMTHIPEEYAGAPSPVDTGSGYGQAKRVSEFLCCVGAQQYGGAALIARLFAFMGPHLPLDRNFAADNFLRDVLKGGPVRVSGDGTPYRSYLYAADLAVWLWTILARGESARPYNVGSGEAVTIAELAAAMDRGGGVEIAKQAVPGAPPQRYVPSVERARAELGLRPRIGLADAIGRSYAWSQGRRREESRRGTPECVRYSGAP